MSWWIFIHFYLWQNSLRRWWEQPLSLFSKLVVAGLLGLMGSFVVLGLKELGEQLDRRLNDRDTLAVIIFETVPRETALSALLSGECGDQEWRAFGTDASTFLQAATSADTERGQRVQVIAVENPERHGLVDDLYFFTEHQPPDETLEFSIRQYRSEARTHRPTADARMLLKGRDALIGSAGRLTAALANGFTKSTVLHANSVDDVQRVDNAVAALSRVEGKRMMIQSNLRILLELRKVREIQAQALFWVAAGSSLVLGLVFGSLAWMEFREERYLLSLIRSFGVGRWTLFTHALIENCMLAIGGVLAGIGVLRLFISHAHLDALKIGWLKTAGSLYGSEGQMLILGAAMGGVLSCIPIAIGLRKPLGLVLK